MIKKSIGLLLFVISSKLFALTPVDLPADIELFIAGSSAHDKTLLAAISALCKDTPDKYSETGSIPGSAYTAVYCTMSDTQIPGLTPAGTDLKVLIHKRSKGTVIGGEPFPLGAAPVESGQPIARMAVDNTCTLTATPHQYQCTGTTGDIPKAGITDVEPALRR